MFTEKTKEPEQTQYTSNHPNITLMLSIQYEVFI